MRHREPKTMSNTTDAPERLSPAGLFALCWTNNCRNRNDGLYVMHAVASGNRTLCGCEIQEVGYDVDDDHSVGCKRCLRIMANASDHPTVS